MLIVHKGGTESVFVVEVVELVTAVLDKVLLTIDELKAVSVTDPEIFTVANGSGGSDG